SDTYAADAAGRVAAVTYGNGERTEIGWDLRSRIVGTVLRRSDGSVLRSLGLGYDAAGREAAVYDGGGAIVQRAFADTRRRQTRYANGPTRSLTYPGGPGGISRARMCTPRPARVESTAVQYADPVCNFTDQCISAQTESYGALAASSYEKYWLMPADGPGLDLAGKRVGARGADAQLLSYDLLSNRIGSPGPE